jgi:hypothetical protein
MVSGVSFKIDPESGIPDPEKIHPGSELRIQGAKAPDPEHCFIYSEIQSKKKNPAASGILQFLCSPRLKNPN